MQGISDSLAGRAAVFSLLSMSIREVAGWPDGEVQWREILLDEGSRRPRIQELEMSDLTRAIWRGGFPEPALSAKMDARLWQASYVQT